MAIRYEIDSDAVRLFDDNNVCFLYQPQHPETGEWKNAAEMETWAKEYIVKFLSPVATDLKATK